MQSISDALNKVLEDGSWFARAREVELLFVRASSDVRKAVLQVLAGLEFHADNRSGWVVLEDAHLAHDPGWEVRAQRVLAHWQDRRAAFRENEGLEVAPVALGPEPHDHAAVLRGVLEALPAPMEGMVAVVAPVVLERADTLAAEIEALRAREELRGWRWVLVVDAQEKVPDTVVRMGRRALVCDAILDERQQAADLAALVHGGGAQPGTARPRGVVPPPRVDDPPYLDPQIRDAALQQAGIDPAYLEEAPRLQRHVFAAALAFKEGRGADAVREQTAARDIAARLRMHEVQVVCRIALASYLSGLDRRPHALDELEEAAKLAAAHGLGLQEAQARLAMGLLLAVDQRFNDAVRVYTECARGAERAGIPLLAIEGWRLAGQIAAQLRIEQHAAQCFQEAIRIATASDPAVVRASSASDAARRLAALCRELGLDPQASSLEEHADRMDAGEVGRGPDITPSSAEV